MEVTEKQPVEIHKQLKKKKNLYHQRISSNHKGRQQERKKEIKELQNSQKTINKMSILNS